MGSLLQLALEGFGYKLTTEQKLGFAMKRATRGGWIDAEARK
jgi:hypothetical protein